MAQKNETATYSRPTNSDGTVELFVEDVLEGQTFGSGVEFVSTTTQSIRQLAVAPGGIYFASAPEVVPQCTIQPLPLSRQDFLLTDKGQNLIAKAGFVRIR
ncbi:MAG TPA: hypothetical protein V6C63_10915 [Allocoleopsis sp.]